MEQKVYKICLVGDTGVGKSSILKRYIALAHVKSNFAMVGTALDFEIKIEHFRRLTKAKIVKTPFFDPARKRSCPK